uniref:Uncharacterized protein n=1 Tax=Ciona intestinalis TaxID=7719 RepID=H2XPW6_CIOIN
MILICSSVVKESETKLVKFDYEVYIRASQTFFLLLLLIFLV